MKMSLEEKETTEILRNLSKLNTSDVNNFMKSLMLVTLLNYSEGESTKIPYFGELNIKYLGDETKSEGRVAKLDIQFTPSNQLIRNIGQLEDVKNKNLDVKITDVDCIKEIMGEITKKLNEIMDKDK